ncbi:MAG: hypothetical protein KBC15_01630 [Candidatus Levybacteria bacterium]|nr:hypothetical protein [Candidatus Levybacteria bacterium]
MIYPLVLVVIFVLAFGKLFKHSSFKDMTTLAKKICSYSLGIVFGGLLGVFVGLLLDNISPASEIRSVPYTLDQFSSPKGTLVFVGEEYVWYLLNGEEKKTHLSAVEFVEADSATLTVQGEYCMRDFWSILLRGFCFGNETFVFEVPPESIHQFKT